MSEPTTAAAVLALKADVEQSPDAKLKDGKTLQTANNGAGEEGGDLSGFPKFDDMTFVQIGLILFRQFSGFYCSAEETIVATSVASIGAALDTKSSLTWISTSYLLTTTIIQPITGRVADAVGSKRLLLIELWIFIIGNIVAGTSSTLGQIIAGRLISGLGGAGLISLACILVSQLTHEKQRASYMNLINVTFIISNSLGPIIGGALARSGNWRWIFLLNAPFGPVITFILLRYLRIPSTSTHIRSFKDALTKIDLIGMFMLMACLSFIVVSLNSGGQETSWGSPEIIGLLVAAGISWIGFWVAEKHTRMPIAPMKLFVQWEWRNVPLMIVFLQVIGLNEVTSSALIIPFLLVAALSSSAANVLCSKYGHGLMSTLTETSSIGKIVGYSLIAGLGFGSGNQLTMIIAQVGLPADELSTVTALVGSAPSLGGTLGVAVIGSVINNAFRQRLLSSSSILTATSNTISLNPNDVVQNLGSFPEGDPARQIVVDAYVTAWQKGCWASVGVAGLEILLFLFARRVEMDDGSKKESGVGIIEREVEEEKVREEPDREKEKEKNVNYQKEENTNDGVVEVEGIREERREIIGNGNEQEDRSVQEDDDFPEKQQATTDDDQVVNEQEDKPVQEDDGFTQEQQVTTGDDQVVSPTPAKSRIGAFLDRLLIGSRVKA
ncbi:MFS general substrate transporter [Dendrothele bispora CBS 962.96]|uniref:MFS general substrate transporter n=1 Tax=Dendrothele bispora (strain CBS 962.96) TaxID=1314807 RepID=A0A4S8M3F9_DENBC|nr:MFS general substrate transporter [Dendrothele bispora CBS 962.96]